MVSQELPETTVRLARLLVPLTRIGRREEDSDDTRLQKTLLLAGSLTILPAAFGWGTIYLIYAEPMAAAVSLAYGGLVILSILYLAVTGRYRLFAFGQLFCTLLLPFILTLLLGGFQSSSAIILGALMCPLGALLYYDVQSASRWFVAYTVLVLVAAALDPYVQRSNNLPAMVVSLLFALNIVVVTALAFFMLRYFVRRKDEVLHLLKLEQMKSEGLLLNVLPKEVAEVLKNEQRFIADRFESVSILFADLVNFTELSSAMDPAETVNLLNQVFSHFDTLVAEYGLEKIRTIGDEYMVAAGVPRPRADHACALAEVGLKMLSYIDERIPDLGQTLQFRIGMNSGPVVAGVIGRQKFHYDLWGDAVNIASRMQSHGEPGKIQIARGSYELLKDEFICQPRGPISVKGVGPMETWFLTGRRRALP